MAVSEPVRSKKELKRLAKYWLKRGNFRNYALIVLGAFTALRISDLLKLTWAHVYDETQNNFRTHISLIEKKTGKQKKVALNSQVINALKVYFPHRCKFSDFIFSNNRKNGAAINRTTAWRIIKTAAKATNASATISPHSLRKTLGYFAWLSGVSPVMIMDIYNHSSYKITKRYLGITQNDRDKIYLGAKLFNFFIFLGLMLSFIK